MLTQTSVKVSLAYSTIAQMGFMMLQCGLGAYPAALLHIVAHSLYKAHAFLSSGSVIDLARASSTLNPGGKPHPARLGLALALVLSAAMLVGTLAGASVTTQPGVFALGAIVLLGLVHLVVGAIDERPNAYVLGRVVALAFGVAAIYYALQWGSAWLLAGVLPPIEPLRGPLDFALVAMVVGGFAAITVAQSLLPGHAGEPRWQALYVHVSHGFYVNTLANRLVVRFWPAPPPRPSLSPHPIQEGA
jgi:NAD(P)H-quinone oxidoreductase subunit 5